jgi:pyruvate-formate lyase-activating enzyme
MANYGTLEFYQEELAQKLKDKEVLYNALENIMRKGYFSFEKLDYIVEKIHYMNMDIKHYKDKIAELTPKESE